jgi:hypothetical protein
MENNLFSAFRIGQQGGVLENSFIFKARKDCQPILVNSTFEFSDIKNDSNLLIQIGMMRYANSWLRQIFRNAKESTGKIDSDLIELILDIDEKFDSEKLSLDPMACGERLLKLVFLYFEVISKNDILIPDSSLQRILKLRKKLIEQLLKTIGPANNHSLQGAHALFAEALYSNNSELARDALACIESILKRIVGSDGFWLENSAEYHLYGIQLLGQMNGVGWYKDTKLQKIHTMLLKNSQLIFANNHGDAFAFGDTDRALIKRQVEKGVFSVPPLKKDSNSIDFSDGILTSRLHKQGFISSICATNFYHSPFHKHDDELSFEWFYSDRFIVLDPGKLTYQNGVERSYAISGKAHNAIDLSDLNHYSKTSHKRIFGECDFEGEHHIWMSIDQNNFSVSREIRHKPQEVIIQDHIYLSANHGLEILTAQINIHPTFSESQVHFNEQVLVDNNGSVLKITSSSSRSIHKKSKTPFLGWYANSYQEIEGCNLIVFEIPVKNRIYAEFNLKIDIK